MPFWERSLRLGTEVDTDDNYAFLTFEVSIAATLQWNVIMPGRVRSLDQISRGQILRCNFKKQQQKWASSTSSWRHCYIDQCKTGILYSLKTCSLTTWLVFFTRQQPLIQRHLISSTAKIKFNISCSPDNAWFPRSLFYRGHTFLWK